MDMLFYICLSTTYSSTHQKKIRASAKKNKKWTAGRNVTFKLDNMKNLAKHKFPLTTTKKTGVSVQEC
jgi:hypothetical protein